MKPLNQNTYKPIPHKPYWTTQNENNLVLNSLYRAFRYAINDRFDWTHIELNQALKGGLAPKI